MTTGDAIIGMESGGGVSRVGADDVYAMLRTATLRAENLHEENALLRERVAALSAAADAAAQAEAARETTIAALMVQLASGGAATSRGGGVESHDAAHASAVVGGGEVGGESAGIEVDAAAAAAAEEVPDDIFRAQALIRRMFRARQEWEGRLARLQRDFDEQRSRVVDLEGTVEAWQTRITVSMSTQTDGAGLAEEEEEEAVGQRVNESKGRVAELEEALNTTAAQSTAFEQGDCLHHDDLFDRHSPCVRRFALHD
jgi:hypothetical protein